MCHVGLKKTVKSSKVVKIATGNDPSDDRNDSFSPTGYVMAKRSIYYERLSERSEHEYVP